jgi:hypothetical protein
VIVSCTLSVVYVCLLFFSFTVSLSVKGNNFVTMATFYTEQYADIRFVFGYCDGNARAAFHISQRRFSDRRIPDSESSVMCTGVSENLVESLKQNEKNHYDAMPTWKMTYWKWYSAVQVPLSEEFPIELGPARWQFGEPCMTMVSTRFTSRMSRPCNQMIFLYSVPAKCRIRDEASNLNTEDMIMCCVVETIAHLGRRRL